MTTTDDDLSRLLDNADDVYEESGKTVRSAAEANKERMGKDRSWIAKSIIFTYAAAIVGAILYIMFTVPECSVADCTGDESAWSKQADLLLNLIVTAVVPVVTLMLGFYFGTEQDNGD